MLTRHFRFNTSLSPPKLGDWGYLTSLSLPFHSPFTPLSLPFISETYMFHPLKDRVLGGKR